MRIGAHSSLAGWSERLKIFTQSATLVEQFFRLVTSHPLLKQLQMLRLAARVGDRHLMRAPEALDFQAVDFLWTGPAFGTAEHDHRPFWPLTGRAAVARRGLDGSDLVEGGIQRCRHQAMHRSWVVTFDKQRLVAIAEKQVPHLIIAHPADHRRIGDLVAVEVKDRQYGAIVRRIQEFVGMPGSGKGTGFGLAVADHAGADQIGIVECGAVGMHQRVAELAAFVNRARGFRCSVARNSAWKRELAKQFVHAVGIAADIGIDFAVSALEIGIGDHTRSAVARAADVNDIEVARADGAIEMGVDEIQSRRGPPMSEQPRLDVLRTQRLTQKGIVKQVYLTYREIIRGTPVPVEQLEIASPGIGIVCTVCSHVRLPDGTWGNKVARYSIRPQRMPTKDCRLMSS